MENKKSIENEFLTIKELSKLLKLNFMTVYKLISEKREPGKIFATKVGRSWRIKREEIDRFFSNKNKV